MRQSRRNHASEGPVRLGVSGGLKKSDSHTCSRLSSPSPSRPSCLDSPPAPTPAPPTACAAGRSSTRASQASPPPPPPPQPTSAAARSTEPAPCAPQPTTTCPVPPIRTCPSQVAMYTNCWWLTGSTSPRRPALRSSTAPPP